MKVSISRRRFTLIGGLFLLGLPHAFGENDEWTDYTNIFAAILLIKINIF